MNYLDFFSCRTLLTLGGGVGAGLIVDRFCSNNQEDLLSAAVKSMTIQFFTSLSFHRIVKQRTFSLIGAAGTSLFGSCLGAVFYQLMKKTACLWRTDQKNNTVPIPSDKCGNETTEKVICLFEEYQIPQEIFEKIFSYLSPKELVNADLVCKQWHTHLEPTLSTIKLEKIQAEIRMIAKSLTDNTQQSREPLLESQDVSDLLILEMIQLQKMLDFNLAKEMAINYIASPMGKKELLLEMAHFIVFTDVTLAVDTISAACSVQLETAYAPRIQFLFRKTIKQIGKSDFNKGVSLLKSLNSQTAICELFYGTLELLKIQFRNDPSKIESILSILPEPQKGSAKEQLSKFMSLEEKKNFKEIVNVHPVGQGVPLDYPEKEGVFVATLQARKGDFIGAINTISSMERQKSPLLRVLRIQADKDIKGALATAHSIKEKMAEAYLPIEEAIFEIAKVHAESDITGACETISNIDNRDKQSYYYRQLIKIIASKDPSKAFNLQNQLKIPLYPIEHAQKEALNNLMVAFEMIFYDPKYSTSHREFIESTIPAVIKNVHPVQFMQIKQWMQDEKFKVNHFGEAHWSFLMLAFLKMTPPLLSCVSTSAKKKFSDFLFSEAKKLASSKK